MAEVTSEDPELEALLDAKEAAEAGDGGSKKRGEARAAPKGAAGEGRKDGSGGKGGDGAKDGAKKRRGLPGVAASPLHLGFRVALGTAGLLLVVGFFLPWANVHEGGVVTAPRVQVSGLLLVMQDSATNRQVIDPSQRYLLLFVPILGLALTAIGYLGFRWSGLVGLGIGLLVLAYSILRLVIFFVQVTDYGLWLVLGGAFVAMVAGLFAWIRAREERMRAKGEVLPPPKAKKA